MSPSTHPQTEADRRGDQAISAAASNFHLLSPDAFVRDVVIANVFGVCRTTVWRWVRNGTLPTPEKINGVTRWRVGPVRRALGINTDAA